MVLFIINIIVVLWLIGFLINDESVNYILNNKAPKKSTISSFFLQESNGFNWMLFSNI